MGAKQSIDVSKTNSPRLKKMGTMKPDMKQYKKESEDVEKKTRNKEYVYFIGGNVKFKEHLPISEDGYYKIGYSGKFPTVQRIKQLQTGNPRHLILIAYFEYNKRDDKKFGYLARQKEAEMHRIYKEHRMIYDGSETEWFQLTPILVNEIVKSADIVMYLKESNEPRVPVEIEVIPEPKPEEVSRTEKIFRGFISLFRSS